MPRRASGLSHFFGHPRPQLQYNPAFAGCIVVVDTKLQALGRSWCLYEIWQCLRSCGVAKLTVSFPGEEGGHVRGDSTKMRQRWAWRGPPQCSASAASAASEVIWADGQVVQSPQ